LKKFWEKYYLTEEEDHISSSINTRIDSVLTASDSTATLKNTRVAQRAKITRCKTESEE
jgi:hypothetical protein